MNVTAYNIALVIHIVNFMIMQLIQMLFFLTIYVLSTFKFN
jgi:hypothetical protein